jgi:hypothetical protein
MGTRRRNVAHQIPGNSKHSELPFRELLLKPREQLIFLVADVLDKQRNDALEQGLPFDRATRHKIHPSDDFVDCLVLAFNLKRQRVAVRQHSAHYWPKHRLFRERVGKHEPPQANERVRTGALIIEQFKQRRCSLM